MVEETMEKESNGGLTFLETLLKWDYGKISLFVHRKYTHTDQYLPTALTTKKVEGKALFPDFSIKPIPLPRIKMT